MEIKKEHIETIINFGAFEYDSKKIGSILQIDENIIKSELKNTNSEFSKLYQKGKDMSDYAIDLKLFELAKNGDIKALEKLELRKKIRNK